MPDWSAIRLLLLPGGGRRYVDADNPVRFIDAFVDGLDLATAGFARVAAKATGRPGYAPVDLLKLYVYGYLNRVRSRRRLEREANRNIFAPRALSASRRLETSLKRLKCAKSGHCREGVQEPTLTTLRATALNCLLFAENGDSEQVIVLFESGAQ